MNEPRIVCVCDCWAAMEEYHHEVEHWAKADAPDGDNIGCSHCGKDAERINVDRLMGLFYAADRANQKYEDGEWMADEAWGLVRDAIKEGRR